MKRDLFQNLERDRADNRSHFSSSRSRDIRCAEKHTPKVEEALPSSTAVALSQDDFKIQNPEHRLFCFGSYDS
jgi:hypothetical protein